MVKIVDRISHFFRLEQGIDISKLANEDHVEWSFIIYHKITSNRRFALDEKLDWPNETNNYKFMYTQWRII